jgi:hypothetical protein
VPTQLTNQHSLFPQTPPVFNPDTSQQKLRFEPFLGRLT